MSPRLSIVVPFHNVERYIVDCLKSLQLQKLTDFEAILVDDGSLDASLDLAQDFCAGDARFRIVRQENQGLGPARNTGVRSAQGEFLTFVDSDDLVPARAYQQMVRSLEESGSDLVSGDARRFNDLGVRESYVHKIPFARERIGTHVREFPALALDRMAWNKVYRRRFWDEQALEFPPILYEDYPVTIKSHVRARAVDVLATPVYYWREREGGELSITQRKWEVANLRDRTASAEMVLDFLAAEAPELLPVVEGHFLHIDVSAMAAALHENDPSSQAEVLALADRIYSRTGEEARRKLIPFEQIQNDLLRRHKLAELKVLVDYRDRNGTDAPLRYEGRFRRHYFLDLPFLGDAAAGVPQELYAVPGKRLSLSVTVRDAAWTGTRLELELQARVRRLPMPPDARVKVWLERRLAGRLRKVELPVQRFALPRSKFPDDRSGVRVAVETSDLVRRGTLEPGFWTMKVQVRTAGRRWTSSVGTVLPGRPKWAHAQLLGDGIWARTDLSPSGFGLELNRPHDVVLRTTVVGEDIVVEGTFAAAELDPAPVFRCRVDDGSEVRNFLAEATEGADGIHPFLVRLPARDLVAHPDQDPVEEHATWLVRLLVHDQPVPLAVHPEAGTASVTLGSRRVATRTSIHGNLLLHEGHACPLVHAVEWDGPHRLRVSGTHTRSDERPPSALVRCYVTPADRVDVEFALSWVGESFEAVVDIQRLLAAVASAPHGDGQASLENGWEMSFPLAQGLEFVELDTDTVHAAAAPREVDGHLVNVRPGRAARMRLVVS